MRKTPPCPGAGRLGALLLVVAATFLSKTPQALAQSPQQGTPSSFLATADDLASRGDTAQALDVLERAIRLYPRLAAAHFRRGMLLSRTATGSLTDLFHRRRAHGALERALELDPGNPIYLLELGRLRLKTPFFRVDAGRLFRRALAAARARGDSTALADVAAELGDIYLRRADISANRRTIIRGSQTFDLQRALEDPRFVEQFLGNQTVPIPDAGEGDRREAEDYYRVALDAAPAHPAAARGLLALLHDAERFEEYLGIAQSVARAGPATAHAQLALGLGLARTGRIGEAAAAFDAALALFDPDQRRTIAGLSPILRRGDARRYGAMSEEQREEFERLFWEAADPVRLTDVNEHRVEHLARVAYADIRYSSTELGLHGWETDRGAIYIRYGPPPVQASFAPVTDATDDPGQVGRITTVWWYPERRLRFVFVGAPGYNAARFAGEFAALAEDARALAPVRYDNLPISRELDSVAVQVARFRDSSGATAAVFYAGIPVARLLEGVQLQRGNVETGLFIVDQEARPVVERRQQETTGGRGERQFEARTFEVRLAPGSYHYRVEALEHGGNRAARGAAMLEVEPRDSGFALSDAVLADLVAPRTETPRDRRDFLVDPNPAMSFEAGQPLHLLWEIYGLRPDSTGTASYTVSLAVELQEADRPGVVARLVGGAADLMGLTEVGEARVVLTYQRELDLAGRDPVVEHVALDLGASPRGRYQLVVAVEDRAAGRTASTRRVFALTRPEAP